MEPTFQLHRSKYQKLEMESNDGEDIISNLPDCILCYILSLLPTKDTILTSILSTRWRHLWASMSSVDLDEKFIHDLSFADIVDRVLLLHDDSDIKSFRLSFSVPVNIFRINSWVLAAIKHQVQVLDLSLPSSTDYLLLISTDYLLPLCLFTSKSLTVLKLVMEWPLKVPTLLGLPSLKRLDLSMVTFSDENSFERLISGCPMLQELTFFECGWMNITKATIYVPSLKKFTFTNDDCLPGSLDCTINIHASNLAFLEYNSDLRVACLLCDLPSSVNASIDFPLDLSDVVDRALTLLNCFLNIKSLTITSNILWFPYEEYLTARGLTLTFNKLTTLSVILDFNNGTTDLLLDFLRRSPTLEFLAIQIRDMQEALIVLDDDWEQEMVPSCLESHLKTISISWFEGSEEDMHIVKVLLKKATAMERMIIHYYHNSKSLSDLEKKNHIRSQLQMLPRGAESCVIELV